MDTLTRIFKAESVAIVGASSNPEKRGHIILKNIIDGGFKGKVYPINPGTKEILGLPCYPSINEIPGKLDLLVISIPAKNVPEILRNAKGREIAGAIVISGGFREAGNLELENDLFAAARESGIRIIGPNCQGINFTPNKLCASWPLFIKQGSLAIISQSGTIGATLAEWAEEEEIGISGFVSLGNRIDIDESELLEFFGNDNNTKAIALYLEGVKDGQKFIRALKNVSNKKPVVVLKGGRTKRGREAAQSHTKSVAGNDLIFDAACRQFGGIKAEDIIDLYDISKAGSMLNKSVKSVFIITSSGGSGILATDYSELYGLEVPPLPQSLKGALTEELPSHCIINNPLDLTGDTDAQRFKLASRIASEENFCDCLILIFGDPIPGATEICTELKSSSPQEIVAVYLGGGEVGKAETKRLLQRGVITFPTPERAAKAIGKLIRQEA
ncbi:MAG: CoA-binding protein [Caldiserica bacterium]|nr:CoA-binding protein [Caldisericota bacterium]